MKKLPPSGYVPAAESAKPGYLARRMAEYKRREKERKEAQDALDRKITRIERKVA